MDERLRFVARLLDGEKMVVVCREFGISRKTGYKIFNRYKDIGLRGFEDRPKSPYRHPNKLPFQVEKAILRIKQEHATRGAPKIRDKLIKQYPMIKPPAASTIHVVLNRHGLVKRRKRRRYKARGTQLNHLVFAEPGNMQAKTLLAATYDQLGYQAESGPWRDVYLTAARELRHGTSESGIDISLMEDILRVTPISPFFDSMAVRLNGPDAEDVELSVNIVFTDLGESYLLDIGNAVLHHRPSEPGVQADATLKLTHELFVQILIEKVGLKDMLLSDELEVEGSTLDLMRFFSLLDKPSGTFNIVTP